MTDVTIVDGIEFKDISMEQYREYVFANGAIYRIDAPLKLNVAKSGGHRVIAGTMTHYVPPGWANIHSKQRPGCVAAVSWEGGSS